MLSYPVDEAEGLLASRLSAAKQNLANCEEDLDFLREQITVCLGYCVFVGAFTDLRTDHGGSYGPGIQLGCHDEEKRER
jgi:hypothetical protein